MSTRTLGTLLVLIALVLSLNVGEFAAQDPAPTTPATQPDLSGTYTGTFNCDAAGLTGDTTLTITGNQFTTADGKTGRIVASRTAGYTAVALQIGEATAATPPQIISMRARKSGDRLTLMPVSGSAMKCSFTPSRAVARGRRNQRTPSATGTEVANPATEPAMPVTVTPPTTPETPPAPIPAQTPAPSPNPSPAPSPEPSPEPQPSPEPSPVPTATPAPTASPTPNPSPSPSPTPSPAW